MIIVNDYRVIVSLFERALDRREFSTRHHGGHARSTLRVCYVTGSLSVAISIKLDASRCPSAFRLNERSHDSNERLSRNAKTHVLKIAYGCHYKHGTTGADEEYENTRLIDISRIDQYVETIVHR